MYYSFNEIYEPELINILWNNGLKDLDIINKIIKINKEKKILSIKRLENESKNFYLELDSVGEYNNETYLDNSDWTYYRLWYNLHKELLLWHKYF